MRKITELSTAIIICGSILSVFDATAMDAAAAARAREEAHRATEAARKAQEEAAAAQTKADAANAAYAAKTPEQRAWDEGAYQGYASQQGVIEDKNGQIEALQQALLDKEKEKKTRQRKDVAISGGVLMGAGLAAGAGSIVYSVSKSSEAEAANIAAKEQKAVQLRAEQEKEDAKKKVQLLQGNAVVAATQSVEAAIDRCILKLKMALNKQKNQKNEKLTAAKAELTRAKEAMSLSNWAVNADAIRGVFSGLQGAFVCIVDAGEKNIPFTDISNLIDDARLICLKADENNSSEIDNIIRSAKNSVNIKSVLVK
ncbi:MAG: hypothetical protein LBO73_04235 [Holosporaceae bacterium]|jgi:hypothetical protein|nr:hypothetical protein [Holosporaceae bacterium]